MVQTHGNVEVYIYIYKYIYIDKIIDAVKKVCCYCPLSVICG